MDIEVEYIYAIPIKSTNKYLYFLCVGENKDLGYMIKVFDYTSNIISPDINIFSSIHSVFLQEYITAYFTDEDKKNMHKVGKIDLNYKSKSYSIIEKSSDSCSFNKLIAKCQIDIPFLEDELRWDITDDEYFTLIKDCAKKEIKIICNDWKLDKYHTDKNGKIIHEKEFYVGNLSDIYKFCQIFGTAYLKDDIVEYVLTGIDRITAEAIVYQ